MWRVSKYEIRKYLKTFSNITCTKERVPSSSPFTISRTTMVSPAEWKMVYWGAFLSLIFNCKMLKVAIKFSFTLIPYAKLRKNASFSTEIHDIYAEYKEKHGKGMKAPWILIPSKSLSIYECNSIRRITYT